MSEMKKGLLLSLAAALLSSGAARAGLLYWSPENGGDGHYYEAIATGGINWFQANAAAVKRGGYLATITSAEENAFVFALIRDNPALWAHRPSGNSFGPWIGGYQPAGSSEPADGWT